MKKQIQYPMSALYAEYEAKKRQIRQKVAQIGQKRVDVPNSLRKAYRGVEREIQKLESILGGILPRASVRERDKVSLLKFSDPVAARKVILCAQKLRKQDPHGTATSVAHHIWATQTGVYCWTIGPKAGHRISEVMIKRLVRCIFGESDLRRHTGKRTKTIRKNRKRRFSFRIPPRD